MMQAWKERPIHKTQRVTAILTVQVRPFLVWRPAGTWTGIKGAAPAESPKPKSLCSSTNKWHYHAAYIGATCTVAQPLQLYLGAACPWWSSSTVNRRKESKGHDNSARWVRECFLLCVSVEPDVVDVVSCPAGVRLIVVGDKACDQAFCLRCRVPSVCTCTMDTTKLGIFVCPQSCPLSLKGRFTFTSLVFFFFFQDNWGCQWRGCRQRQRRWQARKVVDGEWKCIEQEITNAISGQKYSLICVSLRSSHSGRTAASPWSTCTQTKGNPQRSAGTSISPWSTTTPRRRSSWKLFR